MALQAVKQLIEGKRHKVGNHEVKFFFPVKKRHFYYHWSVICKVDDEKRVFGVSNCGWGTTSTTRAINSYRHELSYLGYKEVKYEEIA